MKLYRHNKSFYLSSGRLSGKYCQDDRIYALTYDYFTSNCETIADGIWHLQKVDDFKTLYKHVCDKWREDVAFLDGDPGPPPRKEAVQTVLKRDWSFVKEIRVGEYGMCWICFNLHQRREQGFSGEHEANSWKAANELHHKIHQTCRKQSMLRQHEASVNEKWMACHTIDMSKPFYFPGCRRLLDDFKGAKVISLQWGGSISFGGNVEYILAHGPDIAHGANANITFLYHILRNELWNERTMCADCLFMEIDGGPENTAHCMFCFWSHLVYMRWKNSVQPMRMVRHHTHNIQDQRFYVVRYFGWNSTFTTTNLAQALAKMLLGYSRTGRKAVLLLLVKNYDWDKYFKPCWNENVKYAKFPLGWLFRPGPANNPMPTAQYKQWGDASAAWCGEGGKPDGAPLKLYVRPPTQERPDELPVSNIHMCLACYS